MIIDLESYYNVRWLIFYFLHIYKQSINSEIGGILGMTFREWVANPSGKGSAVMSTKQLYKDMYTKKMNLLFLRESNKFKYTLYRSADEYDYYIHIMIPSEVVPKFYYDVVIRFFTKNSAISTGTTLDKYDIQIFTNSPDFMFTHAHAYHKQGLLFNDMVSKIPKESLRNVAKERNPKDEIGYIKSIYFTYLIMVQHALFNKVFYRTAQVYKKKEVLQNVMPCTEKAELRQKLEADAKAKERRKKRLEERQARDTGSDSSAGTSAKSPTVRYTKKSPTTKKSKTTNTVKKK